jgi:hypothetical protein
MGKLRIVLLVTVALSILTFSQSQFNTQAYKSFLLQNQNLSTNSFYQTHDAGVFRISINQNLSNVRYLDSIIMKYSLTGEEKALIHNNGFMVSQRLKSNSFGGAFDQIFYQDLPLFISSDAILHAYHYSYDLILKDFELGFLATHLQTILNNMAAQMPTLAQRYADQPAMNTTLNDVDVYLNVPRQLFNSGALPFNPANQAQITGLLQNIATYQPQTIPLFSESSKSIDFSQFQPRGHYTDLDYPVLQSYFKAMMWLGRIEIYLLAPRATGLPIPAQTPADIQRQTIDAFLLNELIDMVGARTQIRQIEDFLKFFIGEQDNVTCDNIVYLKNAISLQKASDLLDTVKLKVFQDTLRLQSFANQRILSQIIYNDPMSPDSVIPASAFLFFGQRFIVDSYVTGSVVYDKIRYQGNTIRRMLPSSLDVLFALGNNAAGQLLKSELDQYHYAGNLAALQYLVSAYDSTFWQSSLYNYWLQSIRTLNPPTDRESLPLFMRTAAFWQEKMNTQLASWAQLRHDNLLYAKQSYSGAIPICSYPYAYIEPFPQLYHNLKNLALAASQKIQAYDFTQTNLRTGILSYFSVLAQISDSLEQIASAEAAGIPLAANAAAFLQSALHLSGGGCTPTYDGWYPQLFYHGANSQSFGAFQGEFITADYHTAPTDADGNMVGWVKEAGTGPVELGVFVAPVPGVGDVAFCGPVLSFEEYTTTNFKRLTDDEWASTYQYLAPRPSFVNLYLADSAGNSRGDGLKLLTGVEQPGPVMKKDWNIRVSNYPNPFNSTTIIQITVPFNVTDQTVEISIYDINGKLVDRIKQQNVSPGNYLIRWSPKERIGYEPATGIYLCNVKAGSQQAQHKLMYLK